MNIGFKLLQLRNDRNWTQDYVAHKFTMTQSAYSKIENNVHPPTIDFLQTAGMLYNIDPSELLKSDAAPTQINNNQTGGNAANYLNNPIEQLVASHNETVAAKNETIEAYKGTMHLQKELIQNLTLQLEHVKPNL